MRLFPIVILMLPLTVPLDASTNTAPLIPQAPAAAAARQDGGAGYYFMLGRHLENEGKIEDAIAAHRKAIEMAPQSAELRAELAGLFARQDRGQEALDAAEAALAQDSDNREANRIVGTIYAALTEEGKPLRPGDDPAQYAGRAVEALEKGRRDGSFDVRLELMLGRLYLQRSVFPKAILSLRKVVDDQPGYPEAAMLLVAAQEGSGMLEEAARTLEGTLAQNPEFFRGHIRLAELYDRLHHYKDAADAYARAQTVNTRVDLSSRRAAALINAGRSGEARDLLQAALARAAAPDPGVLYMLAQAQRQLKDLAGAEGSARKLEAALPGDPRVLYLDAQIMQDRGRTAEAIAAFQALIKRTPENASLVYEYSSLLERAGRTSEAEAALRDLLARDPLDSVALNSLGYMLAERGGSLSEAVDLVQRALKIEPANPSYLDSLGWAFFKQGRIDLADGPLSQAAAKMPKSAAVQEHLGDLRYAQQRWADAAAAFERALAGDVEAADRSKIELKLSVTRDHLKK